MDFKFTKRKAEFGKFNLRDEFHGNQKQKAVDVPVIHRTNAKEMDMLVPFQDGKLSEKFFDKKGNRLTNVVTGFAVERKPEHISISLWDNPDGKPIEIADAKVKGIYLTLGETIGESTVEYKLQFDLPKDRDGRHRLINCMGEKVDFSCKNTQEELFKEDGKEDDQEDLDKAGKEKAAKGDDAAATQH